MPGILDAFTTAYAECAFWSSNDDKDRPMDLIDADPAPELWDRFAKDCAAFQSAHGHLFAGNETQAGHDFWLTRNGHGAGFWDRDDDVYPKPARDALTTAAHGFGECNLYIGDDGQIYAD